jgi:hypothetical protein
LGVVLDKEALILSDVRDLMALQLCLQRALAGDVRRPWAILHPGYGSSASRRVYVTAAVGTFWSAVIAKLAHAVGYSSTR